MTSARQASINGRLVAEDSSIRFAVLRAGLLSAAQVRSHLVCRRGELRFVPATLLRLRQDATQAAVGIAWDDQQIERAARELANANGGDGLISIVVCAAYPPSDPLATQADRGAIVLTWDPLPSLPPAIATGGLRVRSRALSVAQFCSAPILTDLRAWAQKEGHHDAVLVAPDGQLQRTTLGALFVQTASAVVTPPVSSGAPDTIARSAVLGCLADLAIEHSERPLRASEITQFVDAFVVHEVLGLCSIQTFDGRTLAGDGQRPLVPHLRLRYDERSIERGAD